MSFTRHLFSWFFYCAFISDSHFPAAAPSQWGAMARDCRLTKFRVLHSALQWSWHIGFPRAVLSCWVFCSSWLPIGLMHISCYVKRVRSRLWKDDRTCNFEEIKEYRCLYHESPKRSVDDVRRLCALQGNVFSSHGPSFFDSFSSDFENCA